MAFAGLRQSGNGRRGWNTPAPSAAVVILGLALLSVACESVPPPLTLEPLASPFAFRGSAPRLTSAHGRTLLSWIDATGDMVALRFVERTDSGWTEPRLVTAAGNLLENSADVPSVVALADGRLAAHWMVDRGTGPEAYDVHLSWSPDDGRTWSPPVSPHHDDSDTQHGFVSLFEPSPGSLGLVWLDGRDTSPEATALDARGDMALRATVFDATGAQGREDIVDARVCECCPTSAAVTAEGVLVAYRGRSAANVRDIQVSRFAGGAWTRPSTVHDDGWTLSACPVNGPSVDARGPDVVVGWFTLQGTEGHAFVAFSSDAGRTFGAPIRVDDESARGRVQVALLDDRSAAVAWIEYSNRESQMRMRRVTAGGARSLPATVASGMGTQHPRLVRGAGELLLAWVEQSAGGPIVQTARSAY